jgi:hypothetical protein
MALDYVATQLAISENSRNYALLLVHDGIAVYGHLSNTNVKILVGTDAIGSARFDLRAVSISMPAWPCKSQS